MRNTRWQVGRACHLVLELKLDLVSVKMGGEVMVGSPIVKCSCRTKAKMVVVKVEKATAKEVHKVKKLAKQATMVELSFAKKLSKTLKGEREENFKPFKPFNPKSKDGGASIEKEFSKGEASKDNIQVVEQLGSTSNFSKSNKEEEENLEAVNILKKPIKVLK